MQIFGGFLKEGTPNDSGVVQHFYLW